MLVPEAAMNKYHFLAGRKNDIGFSRKIFAMQAEPVTLTDVFQALAEYRLQVIEEGD